MKFPTAGSDCMPVTSANVVEPESIDAKLVSEHLSRIEFSDTFNELEHQRRLLRLLVEQRLAGRHDQLSQSEIVGLKMVSRSACSQRQELLFPDEQAVRTHIGRLRKSLLAYYKYEAPSEPLQIDIPKRKYIATFAILSAQSMQLTKEPDGPAVNCAVADTDYRSAEICNKDAVSLYKSGRYVEAEPILKRVLAIRERSLGPNHPDTATSLNNLAMLYEKLGRHAESLPLLERALAICRKALGLEHPDTIISLNNLAIGYISQARYSEALPILERALDIREKSLGSKHPDTASSLNNLAMLYEKLGRYQDAVPILHRALSIREQSLGPEHPETGMSLNNLAMVYKRLAEFPQAAELSGRAAVICEKVLGAEHPDTVMVRSNYIEIVREFGPAISKLPSNT